jgi:DNA-binding beta-propeller fold protein YncE
VVSSLRRFSIDSLSARRPWLNTAVIVFFATALSSCATVSSIHHPFKMPSIEDGGQQGEVWPAPPAVPRYAFIGHIYGESNLRDEVQNRSSLARFWAAVVGLDVKKKSMLDVVRPQQVTTDNKGKVYVTDPGLQSIFVFDEILQEFVVWNERSLDFSLPSPIGIVHAEDSIWVTDSELALVYRLSLNGEVLSSFGRDVLKRPTGISFDPQGRRFFISDTDAGDIKLFNMRGELIDTWGSAGSDAGQFNHPTYLVYRQGRLYVADSLNARIQIFDHQGQFIRVVGQRGLYVGNFSRPKGIALDSDGNVYVSESYYDYLLIYNQQGELLMSIGGSGPAAGQFSQPTGIWVDDRDRVFVSDMLNGRISMFQYLGSN